VRKRAQPLKKKQEIKFAPLYLFGKDACVFKISFVGSFTPGHDFVSIEYFSQSTLQPTIHTI